MEADFETFISKYQNNKSIIKDNSFKTIEKFMSLLKNNESNKLSKETDLDFILTKNIIHKFSLNDENILENIENEYLILIYISQKENTPIEFYKKLLKKTIENFDLSKIFLNLKFFKKTLKFIFISLNKNLTPNEILNLILELTDNEIIGKKDILIFFYNYFIFKNNLYQNSINFEYIKVIFDINKILKQTLSKDSEIISAQNYFNYLFNNNFFNIKNCSHDLFSQLVETFLAKLQIYKSQNINVYENFLYIISNLLCPTTEEDINLLKSLVYSKQNNLNILNDIEDDILISNNSILHQISVNILNKNEKKLNEDFMKKYISIYDVLDGFNCHLFKSLEPELKFILTFINNNSKDENINEYMKLFTLLSRKIYNHDNSRIHKFFIKTICKIESLNNQIFKNYLFNDFLQNINCSMLYPENEKNIYHNKVGILIQKFLINYLTQNKNFMPDFIHGLSLYVNNKKIIPYLLNVIDNVDSNDDNFNMNDIFIVLDKLGNGTYSQYHKFKSHNIICKLIEGIILENKKFSEEEILALIKIYYDLFDYLLNFNKDVLFIEYLNFSDLSFYDKNNVIHNCINKILKIIKGEIKNEEDINMFIKNNHFSQNISADVINLLFFSLNNNEINDNFLIANMKKVFSDYLDKETKIDLLHKFNMIMNIKKIFCNNLENNDIYEEVENFYYSLKNVLNSENILDNEIINECQLFLYNYISIYKKGIEDILTNQLELKSYSSNKLLFIKMSLFNYLTCIYFNIFNFDTHLINNKTLNNNLLLIIEFLSSNESNISINENSKILYIKCLVFTLIALNTVKYDKINEIIIKFGNGNSKLNLDFFFDYFEILTEGDLFYGTKFFNIYFNNIELEDDVDIFKTFINKGLKSILEKRENFTYLNISTFIHTFTALKFLSNPNYENIIKETIMKIIDLNENRIWLFGKLTVEIFLNNINQNISLLQNYYDLIIELSIIKETRGEDSFMLNTSPYYIKSPFNLKTKTILPYTEKISQYGLYIRYYVLNFIEQIIKEEKINQNLIFDFAIKTILIILKRIDQNSSNRPEMEFTVKHREKLRLSQLLLTLGNIFMIYKENKNDYINNYKEQIENITKVLISLFSKTNLVTVDFYLNNFNLQFLCFSDSLRNYYLKAMTDPKTKSHIVSACVIITSIGILEKLITSKEEILKLIDAITIQCTSNICNVRGFAQFFLFKMFKDETLLSQKLINENNINQNFMKFLGINPNIQKFFSKFEPKYQIYINLLKDFTVEKMITENFDTIYCESVPIDLNEQFRLISSECLELDNIEYGKVSSSWRFVFDTQSEINIITQNNQLNNDFQKKYRPLDNNLYHDFNKKRKRHDIIVIGSLIDKAPNLGGLTRTCEIFNIGALTIPNESFLNDVGFQRAAASGEKWTPLLSVPPCTVKDFIIGYKKMGYTIIGLEQTQNSIDIRNYKFREKTVIVLGNEKQGIPQDIINLIDNCIIIPQYGNIRSLNVHVSAAIMLWEAINCINNS